jgi:hypothetical protein
MEAPGECQALRRADGFAIERSVIETHSRAVVASRRVGRLGTVSQTTGRASRSSRLPGVSPGGRLRRPSMHSIRSAEQRAPILTKPQFSMQLTPLALIHSCGKHVND